LQLKEQRIVDHRPKSENGNGKTGHANGNGGSH